MITHSNNDRWRRGKLVVLPLQMVLFGCVALMGVWGRLPWYVLTGISLCACAAGFQSVALARGRDRAGLWPLRIEWVFTFLSPAALFFSRARIELLDVYLATLAWIMAALVYATSFSTTESGVRRKWTGPAMAWGLWGSLALLIGGYVGNVTVTFHVSVVATLGLLIWLKFQFRLPSAAVVLTNTIILVFLLLPLVDFFTRPRFQLESKPDIARKYYSYDVARKDPEAFARWWDYFGREWEALGKRIYVHDNSGPLAHRLRSNSQAVFFESRVAINSKGFRGPEIATEKGSAYRIVVLGESSTFGCTLRTEDKPWPEVLEEVIRHRLGPARPVEVINAGVPGWTLQDNLFRLESDILPLEPDMIISYHGINGFPLLDRAIPRFTGALPPKYEPRPLKLLADAEYGVKMELYRRRFPSKPESLSPGPLNPLESHYARCYRQLIEIASSNHMQLAVGTFSLAVNAESSVDVVEFYRAGFPSVYYHIRANSAHTTIVRELAREHPEVILVDTQPHLDGEYEKFIDLMHLTQPGRQQLAESFFAGIRGVLEKDLAGTNYAVSGRHSR